MGNGLDLTPRLVDPRLMPLLPMADRDRLAVLWSLDARLAQMRVRQGNPMLTAIRLRWWTDAAHALALPDAPDPVDPLLLAVRQTEAWADAVRLCAAHELLAAQEPGDDGPMVERSRALGWTNADAPSAWVRVASCVERNQPLAGQGALVATSRGDTRAHRALDAWANAAMRHGRLPSEGRSAAIFLRVALFGR